MATAKKTTTKTTASAAPAKTLTGTPAAAPKVAAKASAKVLPSKPTAVAAVKSKPAAIPKADKPVKPKKPKLVRDSFTIPKPEYSVLDDLKARATKLASPAKKSELLRAGIKALAAMPDAAFQAALKAVPAIKTGRPAKS